MRVPLDRDFLVFALSGAGPERAGLAELADSEADLGLSAVAWYEFARGPRTPEQLAVARTFFPADGVIPEAEEIASVAADISRQLGSPRRRAADIAIGATAVAMDALLVTRNAKDFAGIPGLRVEGVAA